MPHEWQDLPLRGLAAASVGTLADGTNGPIPREKVTMEEVPVLTRAVCWVG